MMNNDFMAFLADSTSAEIVRSWAEKQGFPGSSVETGGADLFSGMLETDAPPKFAFVDLDGQNEPTQIAVRLISLCGPGTRLIAVGSENDVKLYRNILASGMMDYLVKPLTPEVLTQALALASQPLDGQGNARGPKETKIVIILGVRGGVGASTIATNLAWMAAHEKKLATALLDLDLQFGTAALALDLEPGRGLRDVMSSAQRVDGLMVTSAIVKESDKLHILSAEEPLEEPIPMDSAALSALIKELKSSHEAIFVDMPRHLFPFQKRFLSTAHEIVLVSELSLVGIRDTLRLRTTLKSLGAVGRITLVASPIGAARPAAVDKGSFERGTQSKIDFILPEDSKNVIAASNAGKMLGATAPQAALTKGLRDLYDHLLGLSNHVPKKAGFMEMLGFSKNTSSKDDKEEA